MSDEVTQRLQAELSEARRLLDMRTRSTEILDRQLANARGDARSLAQQNEKLNQTLREARESILSLRGQLDALAKPPTSFGVVVGVPDDGLADVSVAGRLLRVAVGSPSDDPDAGAPAGTAPAPPCGPEGPIALRVGDTVLLNEAMTVVAGVDRHPSGEIARVREALGEAQLLVTSSNDEELVLRRGPRLLDADPQPGDSVLFDRRALVAFEVVSRSDVEELTLDEVPDVSYADIGGLGRQIDLIRDAVELPFRHRDLYAEFGLTAPKGVLLYGPPGCGKTMIAKAVANSAGSYFLNIKGPELLNKYVGETERQIRVIFGRARELADEGRPVIIFFDEMDSLFRTRGSGVSSDVESTVVPQLLSEIDGVESLQNVIVIGATNREDLIDPAILRPGRLDVKIKLERPDEAGAREVLGKYLTLDVPFNPAEADAAGGGPAFLARILADAVAALYERTEENEFIEVTYAGGEKETLYVADFVSGAMLANIAGRAKKAAIKEVLAGGERGVRGSHLVEACRAEVAENEDLPNTTNPDDWARVSGKKGERIVYLRTLHGAARALPAT